MPLIQIKHGGTLNSSQKNLCRSCLRGWVRETARAETITCTFNTFDSPGREMREPVLECSEYHDKTATPLNEFYKMAFILEVDKVRNVAGFINSKDWYKKNKDKDPDAWRIED